MANDIITTEPPQDLIQAIRELVNQAKTRVIAATNYELVLLNWHIGKRIKEDVIKNPRADYGEKILATLSPKLQSEFGRGFDPSALARMVKFYEVFPNEEIVATLSQQLEIGG